ncbi:uncharacterized protein LOC132546953 [Ylistrum balloti]|uniref:uncharacterized protein LOC132546953 n=1 Tax=Ylistrum balloti TaxID=509963 RepID=UPI002905DF88|nr:uncharacterized protein LOC132546953 [Ylistrum balloti]
MDGIMEMLRGLQESLNQQQMLLQKNSQNIKSISNRVKRIERQIYDNQKATSTALDYVQEDCQTILDHTADLQSQSRRSSRQLKNLSSGLKLPMEKYVSDSDNGFARNNPTFLGNRRNKKFRRSLDQMSKQFSTPGSDSDSGSDEDVMLNVNGPQVGDHHLIPSGHNSHLRGEPQSLRNSNVIEEVPTTVPPMNDLEGDIKALQSATNISLNQPSLNQLPNMSGETLVTPASTSNLFMSPTEQPSSSTRHKDLASSQSSNGSANLNIPTPLQSNIPLQTRNPLLPSGGASSTNSMFLDQRLHVDSNSHIQPEDSSSSMTPSTTQNTTPIRSSPIMHNTTSTSLSATTPTTVLATSPTEQAMPTSIQTTPTSIQTTPTHTIPTAQTSPSVPNIPLTQPQTNANTASPALPVPTNIQVTPSSTSWSGEMGLFLEPDFSSVEKVIESLGLPANKDTMKAIGTAFTSDIEPPMERPKGLYTVLLVDTSNSTSNHAVKATIKSFMEDFMDEVEDSAANETLEENVALVTFGMNTGVQQGFTNDFSLIRDAFDYLPYRGRSPLATGLAVCLTYMEKSSKQLQQNGMEIYPRLIILTDGFATEDVSFGDDNDQPDPTAVNVKARVVQIVRTFHARKYPVSCGSVNQQNNDDGMIDDIAAIGGGTKIELFQQPYGKDQAKILGRYYFYKTIVAQVKLEFEESGGRRDASKILNDATMNKILNQGDKDELINMLRTHGIEAKFNDPLPGIKNSDESDNEMLKSYTFQELAHMPTIGSRVKKGPQWRHGTSDPGGLGTVVAHASEGVVVVKWDRGTVDRYQYRSDFQEVTFPGGPSQPRQMQSGENINVGCWVKRGPHWSKGDEDGQASHGVVIRRHRNMSVTVKWPIGIVERYKCGQDGVIEVEVVSHVPASELQTQSYDQQLPVSESGTAAASAMREGGLVSCWQFKDGLDQWRTLTLEESAKVDNHRDNSKPGLITITHKGTQYHFELRNMRYREQGGQTHGPIQQTFVTQEDYQTRMMIEDIGAM